MKSLIGWKVGLEWVGSLQTNGRPSEAGDILQEIERLAHVGGAKKLRHRARRALGALSEAPQRT